MSIAFLRQSWSNAIAVPPSSTGHPALHTRRAVDGNSPSGKTSCGGHLPHRGLPFGSPGSLVSTPPMGNWWTPMPRRGSWKNTESLLWERDKHVVELISVGRVKDDWMLWAGRD